LKSDAFRQCSATNLERQLPHERFPSRNSES
jgi:hypothetical protein